MTTYFTYITDQCEAEARRHGVWAPVENLAEKIERVQSVANLDPYSKRFVKKNLGRHYRLIIGRDFDDDGNCLLIFWHVWTKSSSEYASFCRNAQDFDAQLEAECDPPLREIWEEKLRTPPPTQPKPLSAAERTFLFNTLSGQHDGFGDNIILESETWIERTDPEHAQDARSLSTRLGQLAELIIKAVQDTQEKSLYADNEIGILCKKLRDARVIFLIAPVRLRDSEDIEQLQKRYRSVLDDQTGEALYRSSHRSYPDLVLADLNLWERIQKADERANLALSAEESAILRHCRGGHYPLFINGRPGSGKSTILQYLFAEHLHDYAPYADDLNAPPIYLTYSQDLLETAKNNVEAILKSNAYRALSALNPSEAIDTLLEGSFQTLRNYLHSLLPAERKERFPLEKYVRFAEFRLWYDRTFGRHGGLSEISAELAWHVIRSYIKGYLSDAGEYLEDIHEFDELPRKKSVTRSTFRRISNQIWKRYQEWCNENQYWDDQDLVRELLTEWWNGDLELPEHVAVFCDEAQDYSLNELRLIFRLSLYSRRRLDFTGLSRIPFAFAGDPFQTLNPTGFDWDAIRSNFYTIIRDQLDTRRNPVLSVNFEELTFNYRSRGGIVQLCNFIHLLRGIAFSKRGLRPQEAWFQQASVAPVFFDVESPVFQTRIQDQKETVIILPCQEGEEEKYVKADAFLSTFALDERGNIARNLLSPMRAKGMEYKRVVLYKFGHECIRNYPRLVEILKAQKPPQNPDPEEFLPLEYFLNRLYVSASRAQRRLFIVDTHAGLEEFWKRFFVNSDPAAFIQAYKAVDSSAEWEEDDLIKIQPGRDKHWLDDRDDPLEMAKEYEKRGRAEADSFLLRRAALNYRSMDKESDALRCEALALEFQESFRDAALIWQSLGKADRARSLFWKARAFHDLANLEENTLHRHVARFMLEGQRWTLTDLRTLMEEVSRAFEDAQESDDPETWKVVLEALFLAILQHDESEAQPIEWQTQLRIAQRFHRRGLLTAPDILNQLEIRSTVYPDKLICLQKFSAPPSQIVQAYHANPDTALDEDQANVVFNALKTQNLVSDLDDLVKRYPTPQRIAAAIVYHIRSANEQQRSDSEQQVLRWAEALLKHWIDHAQWESALNFVRYRRLPEDLLSSQKDRDAVRDYDWSKHDLDARFIRLLSVSDSLVQSPIPDRNLISGYLREYLLSSEERIPDLADTFTLQQAGGALERAGKVMDCLQFYERVFEHKLWPASPEDQRFAQERWLVCKKRQIDITDTDSRKRKIHEEVNRRAREWGIELDELPEFPIVDQEARPKPVPSDTSLPRKFPPDGEQDGRPPVKIQTQVGDQRLVIQLDRSRGKMSIRQAEGLEMVTLKAQDLSIQGSDDDMDASIETLMRTDFRAEYHITPWNLTCVLRKNRRRVAVVYADLFLGRKKFEFVSLRLAD